MDMEHIREFVERENDLKRLLKETRQEIKEKIEGTRLYKQVYESTMQSDYQVSEKTAKAHAFKVVRSKFDDKDDEH
jgi:hypothetical protein